jgi:hypothetical protein
MQRVSPIAVRKLCVSNITQSLPNSKYHKLTLLALLDEEIRDIFFAHHGLESYRSYFNCGAVVFDGHSGIPCLPVSDKSTSTIA